MASRNARSGSTQFPLFTTESVWLVLGGIELDCMTGDGGLAGFGSEVRSPGLNTECTTDGWMTLRMDNERGLVAAIGRVRTVYTARARSGTG